MGLDFAQMRRNMVESQVRPTDVTDSILIGALLDVPREIFVPQPLRPFAYSDTDLLLNEGDEVARYLMQPSAFARLVQLAEVDNNELVLDVGCATGYSSAVLSGLCGAVIGLEQDEDLAAQATETLAENGFDSVAVVTGPLSQGLADEGPYDVILVNGAVDEVPQALVDQLKPGGRLVAIVGRGPSGFAELFVRDDEGVVASRRAFNLSAKTLPGFEKTPDFVF